MSEAGFAHVRREEVDALKSLGLGAAKVWIAIRATHCEGKPFACGSRDFRDWGIGREAAGNALKALVAAGLLSVVREGRFTGRAHKTVYQIVHTRAAEGEKNGRETRQMSNASGRETRPFREKAVGKPGHLGKKTAGKPGTILGLPSSLPVGREGGREDISAGPAAARPPTGWVGKVREQVRCDGVQCERPSLGEKERIERHEHDPQGLSPGRRALMERQQRIGRAAAVVVMDSIAFMTKAGGPAAAGVLAEGFDAGELDAAGLAHALNQIAGRALTAEEARLLVFRALARGCDPDTLAAAA